MEGVDEMESRCCSSCVTEGRCDVGYAVLALDLLEAMHPRVTVLATSGRAGLAAVLGEMLVMPEVRSSRPVEELARYKCLDPSLTLCPTSPSSAA